MASFFASFLAELWATIHSACPEIVVPGTADPDHAGEYLTSNAFTSLQALRDNLTDKINNAPDTWAATPPYVVVHVGDFSICDDAGMHNDVFWAPIRIWYIGDPASDLTPMGAHEKAFSIRQQIDANGHTNFFARDRGALNNSETDAVVSALLTELKIAVSIGSVTYLPGLMVGSNVLA
jgi:hypothetical protein